MSDLSAFLLVTFVNILIHDGCSAHTIAETDIECIAYILGYPYFRIPGSIGIVK